MRGDWVILPRSMGVGVELNQQRSDPLRLIAFTLSWIAWEPSSAE
jgi:hypothetical protein